MVEPLADWATGAPLTPEVVSEVTVPPLDAAGVGYGPATYGVDLVDPSAGQRLLDLVPGVLGAVLVVARLLVHRAAAAHRRRGRPFQPRSTSSGYGSSPQCSSSVCRSSTSSSPVVGTVLLDGLDFGSLALPFMLDIPWVPMLAGMVVALLAEAFKAGSRLRDDVDGLV